MNHLERYLYEVNSFPTFTKRIKFFDRWLVRIAGVGFIVLLVKPITEWIVETLL